jgi:hypothetical protein
MRGEYVGRDPKTGLGRYDDSPVSSGRRLYAPPPPMPPGVPRAVRRAMAAGRGPQTRRGRKGIARIRRYLEAVR